jgi:hypothetical protein
VTNGEIDKAMIAKDQKELVIAWAKQREPSGSEPVDENPHRRIGRSKSRATQRCQHTKTGEPSQQGGLP